MEAKSIIYERFERAVDVPLYLAYRGYRLSEDGDWSRLTMVSNRTGEILDLKKDVEKGTWSYSNRLDPADAGTLADFLVTRDGLSPSASVERMIGLGSPLVRDAEGHSYRQFINRDAEPVRAAMEKHVADAMLEAAALRRLESLGVARGSLDEWRFGRIRSEQDLGKALADPPDFWASRYRTTDRTLVLVERQIDAIAYDKSRGHGECCYLAVGTNLSETQKQRLAQLLRAVPCTKVVAAFGRDELGRRLADEVQSLAPSVRVNREMPIFGARWSEQMKVEHRHVRSVTRESHARGV